MPASLRLLVHNRLMADPITPLAVSWCRRAMPNSSCAHAGHRPGSRYGNAATNTSHSNATPISFLRPGWSYLSYCSRLAHACKTLEDAIKNHSETWTNIAETIKSCSTLQSCHICATCDSSAIHQCQSRQLSSLYQWQTSIARSTVSRRNCHVNMHFHHGACATLTLGIVATPNRSTLGDALLVADLLSTALC